MATITHQTGIGLVHRNLTNLLPWLGIITIQMIMNSTQLLKAKMIRIQTSKYFNDLIMTVFLSFNIGRAKHAELFFYNQVSLQYLIYESHFC